VKQAGSLVTPDRLRFDFSHFTRVSAENLREVETLVNRHIRENLPITVQEMSREDAMKTGAMAIFEERYGDRVRLVTAGEDVSRELCGGTHTNRTGNIGLFRIVGETAVAANVRRIEALTGDQEQEQRLRRLSALLKTPPEQAADRLERLLKDYRDKEREVESLKAKLLTRRSEDLLAGIREIGGVKVLAREFEADSPAALRESADRIRDKLGSGIALLGAKAEGKAMLVCVVTKDLTARFRAGEIIRELAPLVGGKGGGRPDMAQGGGTRPEGLPDALEGLYGIVEKGAASSA